MSSISLIVIHDSSSFSSAVVEPSEENQTAEDAEVRRGNLNFSLRLSLTIPPSFPLSTSASSGAEFLHARKTQHSSGPSSAYSASSAVESLHAKENSTLV